MFRQATLQGTDKTKLQKPQKINRFYIKCAEFYENLLNAPELTLPLTLGCVVLAPCKLFLSTLLSHSQMSSITSSWCWGFVSCCRRSPGRHGISSHPTSPPGSVANSHLLCCQREQTEEHIVEKQKVVLCQLRLQWFLWISVIAFVPHVLLWLPAASSSSPAAGAGVSFPMLKSGLQWTPLKAILILKD